MSTDTIQVAKYSGCEVSYPTGFSRQAVDAVLAVIIGELFREGPKDGNSGKIKLTDDIGSVSFSTWSPRRDSYSRPKSSVLNRLYWDVTVQRTWETSVKRRGIESVDGHPILFARRLHTKHFETYEVVALKRGAGFAATAIRGYVFRSNGVVVFDSLRQRGQKRLRRLVRELTISVLNSDTPDSDSCPW